MLSGEPVLLTSAILFCLGFLGLFKQANIVRIMISIEIMIFASIINFCYFAGGKAIKSGHFAALIAVVLSGLTLSIIYAVYTMQLNESDDDDLLGES